jgi:drug/metabolite transporter (DMT)-like permease
MEENVYEVMSRFMQETSSKSLGSILAVSAAVLWGVSGTFAQFLFQQRAISPEWLVTIRLLSSGTLLLLISVARSRKDVFKIWSLRRDTLELIVFGLFGMLAVQYTYFAAISASNAATATVLQYLGPVFIVTYSAARAKRLPHWIEALAIVLSIAGTFLLVTHGKLNALAISKSALFWGLLSAVALAVYTMQPVSLLKRFPASIVIGWGMIVGGVAFIPLRAPWAISGVWDVSTLMSVAFVILFGTLAAFYSYLTAVKLIGPTRTSLLACTEPLSAACLAVAWLGVPFGFYDWVGTIFIISTIAVLAIPSRPPKSPRQLKST